MGVGDPRRPQGVRGEANHRVDALLAETSQAPRLGAILCVSY